MSFGSLLTWEHRSEGLTSMQRSAYSNTSRDANAVVSSRVFPVLPEQSWHGVSRPLEREHDGWTGWWRWFTTWLGSGSIVPSSTVHHTVLHYAGTRPAAPLLTTGFSFFLPFCILSPTRAPPLCTASSSFCLSLAFPHRIHTLPAPSTSPFWIQYPLIMREWFSWAWPVAQIRVRQYFPLTVRVCYVWIRQLQMLPRQECRCVLLSVHCEIKKKREKVHHLELMNKRMCCCSEQDASLSLLSDNKRDAACCHHDPSPPLVQSPLRSSAPP